MTKDNRKILLGLARDSIKRGLANQTRALLPEKRICKIDGGAFVTLTINGRLRGCIGHFTGLGSLGKTVQVMAFEAAFSDSRFAPLSQEEFDLIDIEISVLSPMKPIKPEDILPGSHGLYIRQGRFAGTLLPQVALEQGWDRETFLANTCMKAGLPPDAYLKEETEIFAYFAEVFNERTERKETK